MPAINVTIISEDPIRPSRTLHTFEDLTINCHLLYLLPRFCSFIAFGSHLLTRIKLNTFAGVDMLIGSATTSRIQTGPSLQRKGPGRVLLPLQEPSCKTSLLSKLTMAPAIRSYSPTTFFPVSIILVVGYEDCDIISERGNPCRKRASKRDIAQGRICPLIPKPTKQGFQN